MGKYSEETRMINLTRSQCEERLMAFDQDKYELKNHQQENDQSLIVLHSKIVFTANGQRITIIIKETDADNTEVGVRSELISNVQINDRGMNKKNISVCSVIWMKKKKWFRTGIRQRTRIPIRLNKKRSSFHSAR